MCVCWCCQGGGSEIIDRYYSWERHYAGIAHWNTLKDALAKLLEATQDLSLHTSPYLGKVSMCYAPVCITGTDARRAG